MLEPIAANCSCALAAAPWPMPTTAMTAPTPMMVPNIVRAERNLLRANARIASRNAAERSITTTSILDRRQRLQHLARDLRRADNVALDMAIAKHDLALGELSDVRLVRDQHNGQSVRV